MLRLSSLSKVLSASTICNLTWYSSLLGSNSGIYFSLNCISRGRREIPFSSTYSQLYEDRAFLPRADFALAACRPQIPEHRPSLQPPAQGKIPIFPSGKPRTQRYRLGRSVVKSGQ